VSQLSWQRGLKLKQADAAIADYDAALKANPNDASSLYGRGVAKQLKGDMAGGSADMAAATLSQADIANEMATHGVKASATSAQTLDENRRQCTDPQPDLGIVGCTALIQSGQETRGNAAIAFYNRGYAYGAKGDHDRAIQDYDRALEINPAYPEAFYNRAGAYFTKGDYSRAIQDYDQVIKLEPNNASAFGIRCYAKAILGRLLEALADCNQALSLRPGHPDTLDSRGFTYLKLKRADAAIADYDTALKAEPEMAISLYGRGVAKRMRGDTAGGNADMAAATRIQANIADVMAKHGVNP